VSKEENTAPDAEQQLKELFGEGEAEREAVIASLRPDEQDYVRSVVNARRDFESLFRELIVNDLGRASSELGENCTDQYRRRTAIRSLAAAVEGIIFQLKKLALASSGLTKKELSPEEIALLSEQRVEGGDMKKARLPGFRENFKRSLKLFAEVYHVPCPIDFGTTGFQNVCDTFALRDRVMHPKSAKMFLITDEETKRAGAALQWLHAELTRLVQTAMHDLGKRVPPQ